MCGLSKYLQIKSGDVRVLANTSFHLVKKEWSSEIRLHAFKMLQVCIAFDFFSLLLLKLLLLNETGLES